MKTFIYILFFKLFIYKVEKQMFCFLQKSDSRGNKRMMCSLGFFVFILTVFFFLDGINNVLEKNSQ